MNKSQQWSSSGCECTSGFEDIHLSLMQIDADQSKTASMFLHFVSFFSFLPPNGRCTEPAHMSLWCLLLKSLPPHPSLPESMVDCEHLAMILKQTAAKAGPQLGYRARAEARMPSLSLSLLFLSHYALLFCGVWHVCAFRWCACGSALCEGGMRMTTLADIQPDLSVTLLEYSPPLTSSYCQWPPVSCNTKSSGCN